MKLPETDAYVILFSVINNAKVKLGLDVTARRGRRAVTNTPRGFLVDFYSSIFFSLAIIPTTTQSNII